MPEITAEVLLAAQQFATDHDRPPKTKGRPD
jgi:hypothetical protein